MSIKIKSVKQIDKEIEEVFTDVKNRSELIQRIKDYVNNISGKEILSKNSIITSLYIRLVKYDARNGSKLCESKNLSDVLPVESFKRFKRKYTKLAELNPFNNPLYDKKHMPYILKYILESILFEEKKEWLTFEERRLMYLDLSERNKGFKKTHNFITKNQDSEKLIEEFSDFKVKIIISGLIKKGIAPLNSIFYFFDKNKTVKENTEYFYRLVGERYSRNTLQMAISRELNNIKKGKYEIYDLV